MASAPTSTARSSNDPALVPLAPASGGGAPSGGGAQSSAALAPASGSGAQGGEGRIAVSTWNFGSSFQQRAAIKDIASWNVKHMPTSIQCAQEVSTSTHAFLTHNGWVGTPSAYAKRQSAPADKGVGCGLGVFAKETVAKRVDVLEDCCDFPRGPIKWRSPILVAEVHFHFARCGFDSFAVVNTHLHYAVAKGGTAERRPAPAGTRQARREYFDALARALAKSKARVLVGDMNMSCFTVVAELFKRGIVATLVARHMELDTNGKPLYDSCGIWMIGPLKTAKIADPAKHVLAGAAHPAVMEVLPGSHWQTAPNHRSRRSDLRQRIASE